MKGEGMKADFYVYGLYDLVAGRYVSVQVFLSPADAKRAFAGYIQNMQVGVPDEFNYCFLGIVGDGTLISRTDCAYLPEAQYVIIRGEDVIDYGKPVAHDV